MSNKEDHQAYCDEILKLRSVIIEKNKEIEQLKEENCDIDKRIIHVLGIVNECRLFIEQEIPSEARDIKLKDYIQLKLDKIEQLQKENKRLRAEFSGKLTQSPLEMIRAKCEQYWNESNTLCPEEMHNILEFIHQLTRSAEKQCVNQL